MKSISKILQLMQPKSKLVENYSNDYNVFKEIASALISDLWTKVCSLDIFK